MNRGAKTGEQGPATKFEPANFCQKKQQVSEYSKSGGLANSSELNTGKAELGEL